MLGHLGFEHRTFRPTRRGSSSDMIALFSAPRASQRCQLTGDRFARRCSGTAVFFPLSRSLVKRLLGQDYTSRTLRCVGKEPRSRLESTVILSIDSSSTSFCSPSTLMREKIVNGDLQFLRRKSAVRGMVFRARKALSSQTEIITVGVKRFRGVKMLLQPNFQPTDPTSHLS